jgi:hypothetical protein
MQKSSVKNKTPFIAKGRLSSFFYYKLKTLLVVPNTFWVDPADESFSQFFLSIKYSLNELLF